MWSTQPSLKRRISVSDDSVHLSIIFLSNNLINHCFRGNAARFDRSSVMASHQASFQWLVSMTVFSGSYLWLCIISLIINWLFLMIGRVDLVPEIYERLTHHSPRLIRNRCPVKIVDRSKQSNHLDRKWFILGYLTMQMNLYCQSHVHNVGRKFRLDKTIISFASDQRVQPAPYFEECTN